MRHWFRFLAIYAFFIATAPAFAVTPRSGNDIGSRLAGVMEDLYGPLFLVVAAVSYLVGFIMLFKGLDLLKDSAAWGSTRSTKENGAGRGIAHLVSGTVLIAFPEFVGIGVTTMFGDAFNIFGSSSEFRQVAAQMDMGGNPNFSVRDGNMRSLLQIGNFQPPENCYNSAAPAVCFSKNIAQNVVPIGLIVTYALVFLAGALMIAKAVFEFAHEDVGGRGPGDGRSALAKAAVGFLMCNSPFLVGAVSQTVMGQAGVLTARGGLDRSFLSYRFNGAVTGNSTAWLQQHQEMVGYLFTILALFGAIAFFRGVFVLKAITDRRSTNASAGNALVFMFAGVLLANMKTTACYVTTTFGGSGLTLGFCN
ncbi:hypothetical protein AX289_28080 [Methylorubrum populi]|nr:hypothetical protein AX289_28080 [Methylorubrum populi]